MTYFHQYPFGVENSKGVTDKYKCLYLSTTLTTSASAWMSVPDLLKNARRPRYHYKILTLHNF
jgi:hypothetical protein